MFWFVIQNMGSWHVSPNTRLKMAPLEREMEATQETQTLNNRSARVGQAVKGQRNVYHPARTSRAKK